MPSYKTKVLRRLKNYGEDYYEAINNKCKEDSIVIMLDVGMKFYKKDSLRKINNIFVNNQKIYILATGVIQDGIEILPKKDI